MQMRSPALNRRGRCAASPWRASARPGGNATGLSNITGELVGKRLELLKEAVPDQSCCGTLAARRRPRTHGQRHAKRTEVAAQTLGVRLQFVGAQLPPISTGPSRNDRAHANGLVLPPSCSSMSDNATWIWR